VTFKGWPASAIEFFEGLEADNSKVYWTERKEVYENDVKAPMLALLTELTGEFGDSHLFRPYRDTRFSPDKSPYKTTIAAGIGEHGYVQLSAEGLLTGSGTYHMAPDQLERYRQAVVDNRTGTELEAVIDGLVRKTVDFYGTDPLKTAPKGYDKNHPRVHLLRNKGVVASKMWPAGAWLGTKQAKTRVMEVLRAGGPLCVWLEDNVGPSTMEPR
jgi:uncharacterized protein (TIGR02453 family)